MRYSHLGVQLALTIGVFTYAGYWGDTRLGTMPLFTMLGSFGGFGIGFVNLYFEVYRRGSSSTGDSKETEPDKPHEPPP